MPLYTFTCPECRYAMDASWSDCCPCPRCGTVLRRIFAFHIGRSAMVTDAHFNHTTGRVVTSDRDFRDQLSRMSDERSAELGMPHDFQPIDYRDRDACGVSRDDDVLDRIAKQKVDSGEQSMPRKTYT